MKKAIAVFWLLWLTSTAIAVRIPSGMTTCQIPFVAVDAGGSRLTGLSTFTVRRTRNGGTQSTYTTPTIVEKANGVYWLLVDEDTTIDGGFDEQAMTIDVEHAGMETVTIVAELYRSKITLGRTLGIEANGNISIVDRVDGFGGSTDTDFQNSLANYGVPAIGPIGQDNFALFFGQDTGGGEQLSTLVIDSLETGSAVQDVEDKVDTLNGTVNQLTAELTPELHESQIWTVARIDGKVASRHIITKQPEEVLIVAANFAQLLGKNETIESIDAITLEAGDVASTAFGDVGNAEQIGTHVEFEITAGTVGANIISVEVTTNLGNTFAPDCLLNVATEE